MKRQYCVGRTAALTALSRENGAVIRRNWELAWMGAAEGRCGSGKSLKQNEFVDTRLRTMDEIIKNSVFVATTHTHTHTRIAKQKRILNHKFARAHCNRRKEERPLPTNAAMRKIHKKSRLMKYSDVEKCV